jgi:hypothetical protein
MRAVLLAAGLVVALSPAACGGISTDLFTPTNDGGTSSDGGPPTTFDASSGDDGGTPIPVPVYAPGCPATVPTDGSPCTPGFALACEYGKDAHCTQTAACASDGSNGSFTWFVTWSDPSCTGNPASCPASFGAVPIGTSCTDTQDSCTYGEGRCACVSCADGTTYGGGEWECDRWQTPTNCPEPRPLLGTACSSEGQECDYGPECCAQVNIGPPMICTGGYWAGAELGCECIAGACGQ